MVNDSIYSKLKPWWRTIRLLELQPGLWSDTVSATLVECTIGDAARSGYLTISYTWGNIDTTKQVFIKCNGVPSAISENLFTILRRLRRPDSAIRVWADALCINQTDAAERTHQVGLMGEIYKNSSETVIWLGEEGVQDDVGYRFLDQPTNLDSMSTHVSPRIIWQGNDDDERLLQQYLSDPRITDSPNDVYGAFCLIQSIAQRASGPLFELFTLQTRSPFMGLAPTSKASRILAGLSRLMSRPWFTRIWVIQETVLSQRATVHFGMLSAPWSMFATAAALWAQDHHSLCLDLSGTFQGHEVLNRFSNAVLQIDETRSDYHISAHSSTLISLLWKFRPLEATDKRDKVYALLGLTTDWQGRPPMEPDYNMDTSKVFLRTTIDNIHRSQSLTVLSGDLESMLNRKRLANLSSWVMDWSLPCLPQERSRVASLGMYNACGGGTGVVRLQQQNSILEIEGVYTDSVAVVGSVSRHTQISDTQAVMREWNLLSRDQEQKRKRYPISGGTYQEAFWRTLIGDQVLVDAESSQDQEPRHRRATSDDEDSFRAWHMWSRCISRDTIDRRAAFSERDLAEGISSIHYALKTATTSRRFFVTQRGLIGIGPKLTQPGDEVFVVKNSSVPFVLRDAGQRYCRRRDWQTIIHGRRGASSTNEKKPKRFSDIHRLVGDCFVYGIMDGEVFGGGQTPAVEKLWLV